ncbi:hypothetical protein DID88_000161 [Monilinia fructigena]|uniref:Major facilitator superfamily (MFS) profile domain-containing protein n=1 Tax=Monilinia fructigena TaxID=38457 RepID=A0A395IJK0_9HELO|nr:hypothetical protein DID88_000161 [Monilinia fructigena]
MASQSWYVKPAVIYKCYRLPSELSKKLDAESQLDSSTRDDSLLVVDAEMERRVVRKIDKTPDAPSHRVIPEKAKFLTEEEVLIAQARKVRQVGTIESERPDGRLQWGEFSYPPSFTQWAFQKLNAQGLSAPPYFLAFLVVILTTWLADKYSQRGYTILVLSLIGATGYIMLAVSSNTGVRYAGVFLAASGVFPAIGNILPWVLNNQGSESKRGTGIAILNVVGQCGPLLGTRLYPSSEGPDYIKGMWVCAAFMLFNGALAMALRFRLAAENRKLDEKYGVVSADVSGARSGGRENDGPNFRYIL